MRIAVDGRELVGRPRGVGRFLAELLAVWAASDSFPHEIVVLIPEREQGRELRLPTGMELRETGPGLSRSGTWWEQVVLPRALEDVAADVLFAPGYTLPLACTRPAVLGLHDLSFEVHPEWFGVREGLRRRMLTRQSAARARRVVTGSRAVARSISRLYGIAPECVVVAPYGVSPRFRPQAPEQMEALARRLQVRGPLVLAVGTLLERRSPEGLVEAFARVLARYPEARVLFVGEDRRLNGPPLERIADGLGVGHAVSRWTHVPETSLPALYCLARVVVYLSSYEGFGLPPLEALACGTPVIASAVPALVELDVSGATLVDERSPRSVAAALDRHLGQEPGRRVAPDWTARLSWDETARRVQRALEEAA